MKDYEKPLALLGMIALLSAIFACVTFGITYPSKSANPPSFTVSGEGKVSTTPDIAQFTFGISTQGGMDIDAVYKENGEKIAKLTEAVKTLGIEEKDLQTTSYYLNPRYENYRCDGSGVCPPAKIVGYEISNNFTVKVRELDKLNDAVSTVVKNGATGIYGLNFTIDDPEDLKDEAREKAMQNVREKAERFAASAGITLGKILSIDESSGTPNVYPVYRGEVGGMGGGGGDAGFQPGSQDVTVTTTVRYEIK